MTAERVLAKESFITAEKLRLPEKFPFPYTPENFTEQEKGVLSRFFTNVDRPVFAIRNLPQEVVGALFSRYSRTEKSARRVFLDEFWAAPELGIQHIAAYLVEEDEEAMQAAQEKAAKLYKKVFAEYGDDSVIQMGGVHVAFEFVSQIAAKAIEDQRLAAYIEKSTRYVDFSSQVNGHFLFMEPSEIMESAFAEEFVAWNNSLFEAYTRHVPAAIEHFKRKYPLEEQVFEFSRKDEFGNTKRVDSKRFGELTEPKEIKIAREAWNRALKAKALDTIRVFLPAANVTNLGAVYSGQAAEHTLNKMMSSPYAEVRLLGALGWKELIKVAPNFLQNVDSGYGARTRQYLQDVRQRHSAVADETLGLITEELQAATKELDEDTPGVRLVENWDPDTDVNLASQIVYTSQRHRGLSKEVIRRRCVKIKEEDGEVWSPRLVEIITFSVPDRTAPGINRRHKLPRAFEHGEVEFEFKCDFGIFRDLQRNRMSSTERLLLSAKEIFIPEEFHEQGMEEVLADYRKHAEWTRDLHERMIAAGLDNEAEYATMLGNKLRFNIKANIRQWVFFSELRTIPGGHPTYRRAMQEVVSQILEAMPFLKPLFAHVDWKPDYGLGRLKAEIKTQRKLEESA